MNPSCLFVTRLDFHLHGLELFYNEILQPCPYVLSYHLFSDNIEKLFKLEKLKPHLLEFFWLECQMRTAEYLCNLCIMTSVSDMIFSSTLLAATVVIHLKQNSKSVLFKPLSILLVL